MPYASKKRRKSGSESGQVTLHHSIPIPRSGPGSNASPDRPQRHSTCGWLTRIQDGGRSTGRKLLSPRHRVAECRSPDTAFEEACRMYPEVGIAPLTEVEAAAARMGRAICVSRYLSRGGKDDQLG